MKWRKHIIESEGKIMLSVIGLANVQFQRPKALFFPLPERHCFLLTSTMIYGP